MKNLIPILFLLCTGFTVFGQRHIGLDELMQRAVEIHPAIKVTESEQRQQQALKRSSFEIPKTEVMLTYGQYNSIINNDNNITISQTLPFPTVWKSQRSLYKESIVASELKNEAVKNEIIYQVKLLYHQWLYQSSYFVLMKKQDSLYSSSVKAATLRYNTGEGTLLEKTAIETQYLEMQNLLKQSEANRENTKAQLQLLLQLNEPFGITGDFTALPLPETLNNNAIEQHPAIKYRKQQTVVALNQKKLEASRTLPDITLGYFNQTLIGFQIINGQEQFFNKGNRFDGFIFGLSIPLWVAPHAAKVKAAEHSYKAFEFEEQSYRIVLQQEQSRVVNELEKNRNTLTYYQNSALPNATLLERQSYTAFTNGEIDYATFLLNLRQALNIRQNYLQAVHDYNQSVIRLEYLNSTSKL